MGLRTALVAFALAATPAQFLSAHQTPDGGFAEAGRRPDAALTAWAVLGLRAAGAPAGGAGQYLSSHEREASAPLVLAAEAALGQGTDEAVARVRALQRPTGRIGQTVNSTIWSVIALRQADLQPPARTARWLLAQQARSGGWPWYPGGQPDSNDTAAAVQALEAMGVHGKPIRRGLAYLRRLQNGDGGFELTPNRGSDSQSTAWAIQAFLAAGRQPGRAAFAYLARMRRADGSYRYSARYAVTPVWVTAQVLPAVFRKPFPLR